MFVCSPFALIIVPHRDPTIKRKPFVEVYSICLCGLVRLSFDAKELSQFWIYLVPYIQTNNLFQNVPYSCACCAVSIRKESYNVP